MDLSEGPAPYIINPLICMKLKFQLLLVTSIFVLPPLIMATLMLFSSDDAAEVNMSGRQRMLTQKLTKEILTFNLHRKSENAEVLESDKKQIQATMSLFEKTLNALIEGGTTSKTLNPVPNDQPLKKPEASTAEQLAKVKSKWIAFKKLVETNLQSADEAVLSKILTDNLELLTQSNLAVGMIEAQSKQKTRNQKYILMGMCLLSLCAGIGFLYYGSH